VNHRWDNFVAYLIDKKVNCYENIEEDQDVLNSYIPFGLQKSYNTSYGSSDTTILVFDLPADIREPYLMVRGETLRGRCF
jgi:hypothetical protein